jgi:hypothetical protein
MTYSFEVVEPIKLISPSKATGEKKSYLTL